MKNLLVAAWFVAVVAFVGAIAWQANAATPTAPVPVVGLYTPIHPAACGEPGCHCGPHRLFRLRAGRPGVLVRARLSRA